MSDKMAENPFIKQPNYMEGYNEKIRELRNRPEIIAFDKMCYELFEANPLGKQFMQYCIDRYLLLKLCDVNQANYSDAVKFYDGFQEAFRLLRGGVLSHTQRIQAAINNPEPLEAA